MERTLENTHGAKTMYLLTSREVVALGQGSLGVRHECAPCPLRSRLLTLLSDRGCSRPARPALRIKN